jgi:hypothetical protein
LFTGDSCDWFKDGLIHRAEAEVRMIEKNTRGLLEASKKVGLEVNAGKTKCVVMFRVQNAGQSQNIKIDNSSFERVEQFKYLGTNLANQNSIRKEIKSRLK